MIGKKHFFYTVLYLAVLLVLNGCAGEKASIEGPLQLAGSFEPDNPLEYGTRGIYLSQGVKEAIGVLKPERYEFIDAVTKETLTVDQLAAGEGNAALGIVFVDQAQLMLKVRGGVVESIIVGGVPEQNADKFKTNRGLPMYASAQQVEKLYGEAAGDKEMIYKGSKYQALFIMHSGKVIGYRFDPVQ